MERNTTHKDQQMHLAIPALKIVNTARVSYFYRLTPLLAGKATGSKH